jgi:FdhD/NarQ family
VSSQEGSDELHRFRPGMARKLLPARSITRTAWHGNLATHGVRTIPEETPIAFSYNRTTHAVMLATPHDLEDFAIGFSLTEGIIRHPGDILELETVSAEDGIELRMWLTLAQMDALTMRQRRLAGPSGCGLCGLQSLADAVRPSPRVTARACFTPTEIADAVADMPEGQRLNQPDPCGARGRVLAARPRHRDVARGCRAAQRARQAGRRASVYEYGRQRGIVVAVEPHFGRTGAEGRHDWHVGNGRSLSADRIGGAHG